MFSKYFFCTSSNYSHFVRICFILIDFLELHWFFMVKNNILKIDGVSAVDLNLVWDPPWTKDKMSEAAKLELNL